MKFPLENCSFSLNSHGSGLKLRVVKDVLFLVQRMEPALSLTILKFRLFFPASLQAKTAGISNLVDDEAGFIL